MTKKHLPAEAAASRPSGGATPARSKAAPLDRARWIEEAKDLLVLRGVDAVKVEPLALALAVTKGSFYWHFKNRGELLDAVLEDWRRRMTFSIIDSLEASGQGPAERLHALLALGQAKENARDARIELAIRLWARTDARARVVIQKTDALRLDYFGAIFTALGNSPEAARAKSLLAYSYMRIAPGLLGASEELAHVERVLLGS